MTETWQCKRDNNKFEMLLWKKYFIICFLVGRERENFQVNLYIYTLSRWDSRKELKTPTHVTQGHTGEIYSLDFCPLNQFLFLTGNKIV